MHRLVGEAESLQDHDGGIGSEARIDPGVDGQLHVGEHVGRVALGDEQWPPLPRGVHREAMPVDHPHPRGDGIDPETDPGQVEEGQSGQHLDVDPVVGQQQLDGVLRDEGDPGTA